MPIQFELGGPYHRYFRLKCCMYAKEYTFMGQQLSSYIVKWRQGYSDEIEVTLNAPYQSWRFNNDMGVRDQWRKF